MINRLTIDELELIVENVEKWRLGKDDFFLVGSLENVKIKAKPNTNFTPSYIRIEAISTKWPYGNLASYSSRFDDRTHQKTNDEIRIDRIYSKIEKAYEEQKKLAIENSISKTRDLVRKLQEN
ncbi:hypothetical protein KAJ87_01970 [Candidatus Pacearchaeota archaeon]|nr:hypothetical protein [Candidatus Pacearchaeota archaeon]